MLRWFRRLPAYALNGWSVGIGVGLVQLLFGALASPAFAQAATVGAVLTSLPHLTGRTLPTLRRTLLGGLLASLATLLVLGFGGHPVLRGLLTAVLVFVALMGMAWGTRAAPLVFSVTIGVVFALARPATDSVWGVTLATVCGGGAYVCWATSTAKLLEPRYRVLAVFSALQAAAALLVARAAVLSHAESETEGSDEDDAARFSQLGEEVRLAQALQTARDLVHPVADRPGGAAQARLLAHVAELRELVLTSRLDLDVLGHDHAARFVRARAAVGLKRLGHALLRLARTPDAAAGASLEPVALPDILEAAPLLQPDDARAQLLPVVAARLRYVHEELDAIARLLRGAGERSSLGPEELRHFVSDDDSWPLTSLQGHFSLASPVLRHALRSALAMTSVYFLAYALPWTTRPYWLLLSVAVVLRGTLDDTLSRRNARVLGTAIGCVIVTVLVPLVPAVWLQLVFVAAVGLAHAFVNVRYRLTASAATVMALLQAHFASPSFAPLVVERLLDTVLGALFAWAFSYVLPSWERRGLPAAIERALLALRRYSHGALDDEPTARARQRVARQQAYDALANVAAALERSAAEPKRVRPPLGLLVRALEHGQRLMAHLSSLRSLVQRREAQLPRAETRAALLSARHGIDEQLSLTPPSSARPRPVDAEPPARSVDDDPLPWLVRRLEAALQDASLAGQAARDALAALAQPVDSESQA